MSRQETTFCMSPDRGAPPTAPVSVPSPSRTSSRSSLRIIGLVNGSSDKVADVTPPLTSSSQSSLPRSGSDVMPQAEGSPGGSGTSTPDIDAQVIEALRSKDRLFVLKLGEQMEALIKEKSSRSKISLSPENQYQRLLVHRCAAYYKLAPETDPIPRDKSGARDMIVTITIESKIPLRRISELVPLEQTQHPTFKIMRRSELDRRRQKSSISRPGSIVGEDGDLSDPGPSEAGSMGSRSTTSKKHMTIAEREAAYEKARSRIFMDFEEKAKERDTSASSSTLSLVSASGSGSQSGGAGCSSVSDIDDNASTAPTESEWSVPGTDRRRGVDTALNSADSVRSFVPFNVQGPGNGRASGTASPAFTYPSLYDPSAQPQSYEQPGYAPHPGGYMAAPYPVFFPQHQPHNTAPMPPTGPPYVAPYQYFTQYPYNSPPHQPSHSSSDPASPVSGPADAYPHHAGSMPYIGPNTYGWVPAPINQHQNCPSENHSPPSSGPNQVQSPPGQGIVPMPYAYPPYIPPPGAIPFGQYPPFFQPPAQARPHMIHPHSQPVYPVELPPTNGSGSDRGTSSGVSSGKGSPSPTLSRHTNSSGSSTGQAQATHMNGHGGHKRGALATRGAWSYGPGLGMHGIVPGSSGPGGGEIVGPRLNSAMRRTSGASSSSGGYRTPGDETASVASSSASSSSSRRTMSTPSRHPLPPRPDWAAGLKAQPTLHPPMRNKHDGSNSRTMSSPARSHQPLFNHQQPTPQQRPPIHLHPTDFPPLSTVSSPPTERRPPAGGAWSNTSPAARAILTANSGHANSFQGSALFSHTGANRLDDDERGYERPPPKSTVELFNPKGGAKRTTQSQSTGHQPTFPVDTRAGEAERMEENTEMVSSGVLVNKMDSLGIQTRHAGEGPVENTPKVDGMLSDVFHQTKKADDVTGRQKQADGGSSS